jgi:hypothetical protein
MIKPTTRQGVHMNLTPFEQSHQRAATTGIKIVEALAVNKMIVSARAYELDMAKIGNGVPPLSETLMISLMWGDVAQFAVGEA